MSINEFLADLPKLLEGCCSIGCVRWLIVFAFFAVLTVTLLKAIFGG